MKELRLVAASLFLILVLVLPVSAASQGEAKGQEFPPAFLDGTRIPLYFSCIFSAPADQPSFVIHGYLNPNWKDYSGQEKNSLLKDYSFVLEIDGIQ